MNMKKKMDQMKKLLAMVIGSLVVTTLPVKGDVAKCDGGVEIMAIADDYFSRLPVGQSSMGSLSAEEQIEKHLMNMGLIEGYDRRRGTIIVVASAAIEIENPATDEKFFQKRESLAIEAYLNAKTEIARAVHIQFSAKDRAFLVAEFGDDRMSKNAQEPVLGTTSSVEMLSKMPLMGSFVLAQSESWNGKTDKTYMVATAVVWSPQLHERAIATIKGKVAPSPVKGRFSVDEWIDVHDLVSLIGPRSYIDNRGHTIYAGVSAVEAKQGSRASLVQKRIAQEMAMSAIGVSLMGDIEAYRSALKAMTVIGDGSHKGVASLVNVIRQKCRADVPGGLPLAVKELTHPISGRKILVSAWYVDAETVKKAKALQTHLGTGERRESGLPSTGDLLKGVTK